VTNEAKKEGKRAEGVEATWHFGNHHHGDSDDHLVASSVTSLFKSRHSLPDHSPVGAVGAECQSSAPPGTGPGKRVTNEAKKNGKRAEGVEGTWHFGNGHHGDSDDHLAASSVTSTSPFKTVGEPSAKAHRHLELSQERG
jgi:hypothetical protein